MLTLLDLLEFVKFKAQNDSLFYVIYVLSLYKFFENTVMRIEFL